MSLQRRPRDVVRALHRPDVYLAALCVAVSLLFLGVMLHYSRGALSAPLDDTFIYFQYGRRMAEGHPFEYSPGAGFSSGATSMLYPLLLALGYRIGFTGDGLIGFAFALSVLGLAATAVLVFVALRSRYGPGAGLIGGLLIVLNGWLVWGYLSMMEIWLHGTLLVAFAILLSRALSENTRLWPAAMAMAALMVFARPEAMLAGLAGGALGVAVWLDRGRRQGTAQSMPAPYWALLPVAAAALFFLVNWIGSDTPTTNTFHAKSVLSAPYISTFEKIGQIANNFLDNFQGVFLNFGSQPVAVALFALVVVAITTGVARDLQARQVGLTTAAAGLLVIDLIAASQAGAGDINDRYVMPCAPLVVLLAVAGLCELRVLLGATDAAGIAAGAVLVIAVAPGTFLWASRFGENGAEIHLQQRQVGLWLHDNTPEDALIAVNDAGAIAYYSNRRIYDLVGLVTNDRAREFRTGEASVFEKLQRLSEEERPDYFAVYPTWFFTLLANVPEFEQVYAARLQEARVVGGNAMTVYVARYGQPVDADVLRAHPEPGASIDEVDVADLASEDDHGYGTEEHQRGIRPFPAEQLRRLSLDDGFTLSIDGGRVVSRSEAFRLTGEPGVDTVLRGRFVFEAGGYALAVRVNGEEVGSFAAVPSTYQEWTELEIAIPASVNRRGRLDVEISVPAPSVYESYHYWLAPSGR